MTMHHPNPFLNCIHIHLSDVHKKWVWVTRLMKNKIIMLLQCKITNGYMYMHAVATE